MKIALIDPSLFTWPYDLKLAKGLTDIGRAASIVGRHLGQQFPSMKSGSLTFLSGTAVALFQRTSAQRAAGA